MLVPDTIDPYVGWKALLVAYNGELHSPQQTFVWKMKERSEAICFGVSYRWTARKGRPPQRDPRRIIVQPPASGPAMLAAATTQALPANAPMLTTFADEELCQSEPPQVQLPDGMHWSWEPFHHEAASDNNCSCGIYMVNSPGHCTGYIHDNSVLAQINGWGHVIQGDLGARVQYAYPQLLVAPERLRERAEHAAELYGIPLEIWEPGARGINFDRPSTQATIGAMTTAMLKAGITQQQAAAQLQQATNALANFKKNTQPTPKDAQMTPFIGVALASLFAAVVSSITLVFTWNSSYQHATLNTLIGSGLLLLLALFVDFMVFWQKEKTKR